MRVESGGREGKEFGKSLAVIAADPERGRDLAARLEECGFRVTRIVGPEEAADLLRSGGVAVAEGEVAAAEMDRSVGALSIYGVVRLSFAYWYEMGMGDF